MKILVENKPNCKSTKIRSFIISATKTISRVVYEQCIIEQFIIIILYLTTYYVYNTLLRARGCSNVTGPRDTRAYNTSPRQG